MRFRAILLLAALGMSAAAPVDARPRDREQDAAFRATRDGRFLPLREIEGRIVPQMRGFSYLGPELDPGSGRYRLKFMRGPQVVWVDVDARTGEVLGRSGF
ncbi:MAG TPA: PepSY domain-containing protein [Allosphingosinicella sp.]|jgi:uncharacterized membrane protein YkoI